LSIVSPPTTVGSNANSKSRQVVAKGVENSRDVCSLMMALACDLVTGHVSPEVSGAVVQAADHSLKVVAAEHKLRTKQFRIANGSDRSLVQCNQCSGMYTPDTLKEHKDSHRLLDDGAEE